MYCTAFQKEEIVHEEHRAWKMRKWPARDDLSLKWVDCWLAPSGPGFILKPLIIWMYILTYCFIWDMDTLVTCNHYRITRFLTFSFKNFNKGIFLNLRSTTYKWLKNSNSSKEYIMTKVSCPHSSDPFSPLP